MKGITFFYNDIKRGMERMTDEELGLVFRTFMKNIDNEIIPIFDDERLDILADGFKQDMEKGIKNAVARRENGSKGGAPRGNQNAAKVKPNANFDEEVDNEKKEMFMSFLEQKNPPKNQSLTSLFNHNPSISGFCDTNIINQATREKAWYEYVNKK